MFIRKGTMFDFFEVGGAVRDRFLGVNSKDVDFSCVAQNPEEFDSISDAFTALENHLEDRGFKVFLSTPEFLTIRAQVPLNHQLREVTSVADFVLARKDGPSSDGRRPDFVLPGTLMDDLSRRDFTVNAMAVDPSTGELIDPFNGQTDLEKRVLRFVGDPMQRIEEDGLRVLRALRFSVTKNLVLSDSTWGTIFHNQDMIVRDHLSGVSVDRIRDELTKMFSFNTWESMMILNKTFPVIGDFIFSSTDLRLMPTTKQF